MANSMMLAILFCALVPSLVSAAVESCAMTGSCPESVEFETDGGLALLQKKARALFSDKADSAVVPFADHAVNAVSALDAKNAMNAIVADVVDKALHSKTALNAGLATYATNAKYAITATKAVHICGDSKAAGVADACKKILEICAQGEGGPSKAKGCLQMLMDAAKGDNDADEDGTFGFSTDAFVQARQKNQAKKSEAKKLSRHAVAVLERLDLNTSSAQFPGENTLDTDNDCSKDGWPKDTKEVPNTKDATCAMHAVNAEFAQNAEHSAYAASSNTASQAQYADTAENALFAGTATDAEYALQLFDNGLTDYPGN